MLGRRKGISDGTQQIPVLVREIVRAGGQFKMSDTTTRKGGTSFDVEVHATPFTYKGKPHLLAIVRDITEQVQAEEQLPEKEEQYRLTAPILLVTLLPIGPIWATDTIAFFLGGIGYTVVGVALIVTRKYLVESTVGASVNVIAQAK